MNGNTNTAITPWNTPNDLLALPRPGDETTRSCEDYTLCDHMEPEPSPAPAQTADVNEVPMTAALAAALRMKGTQFYDSQPQLLGYLENLKPKFTELEYAALMGMGHGIVRRLAREGKQLQQIQTQDLEKAERFANEVVFTTPVVCFCNYRNRHELRRTWERMQLTAPLTPAGWKMHLLFRCYYVLLEVMEHAAVPGEETSSKSNA